MSSEWITFSEAAEIIRVRLAYTAGRAEAVMRQAKASGEIRESVPPPLLVADDGLMGWNKSGVSRRYSADDLLDWLARQSTPIQDQPPSEPQLEQPKARTQAKRDRVRMAVEALWPAGVPAAAVLANSRLCKTVGDWLKADCKKQGLPVTIISDDTILRAVDRK
jgi:hypothetical protein